METEGKSKSRGEVQREYYEGKRLCDRAKKPEQKTLTISEIPLYRLQMHVDHHPGELETIFCCCFCCCCCTLGPRPCSKAVYLKGLIGFVVSHGDSSVWSGDSECQSWITDYSKASTDLAQPSHHGSLSWKYLAGKIWKQNWKSDC